MINNHDTLQGLYQPLPSNDQPFQRQTSSYITGNRCERGLGKAKEQGIISRIFLTINMHRIFDYEPLV